MECLAVLLTLVSLLVLLFWLLQFVRMMRMPDAAFPGRHDKILWLVTFLVIGVVAPFAFWLSGIGRARRLSIVDEEPEQDDEPEEETEGESAGHA